MENEATVKWTEHPIIMCNDYPVEKPKAKFKAGGKPFYEEVLKHKKRKK